MGEQQRFAEMSYPYGHHREPQDVLRPVFGQPSRTQRSRYDPIPRANPPPLFDRQTVIQLIILTVCMTTPFMALLVYVHGAESTYKELLGFIQELCKENVWAAAGGAVACGAFYAGTNSDDA